MMPDDDNLTPSETAIENLMGSLTPARTHANRDRLMFLAGQASVRRQHRVWQGVSCCMAVVTLMSIVSCLVSQRTNNDSYPLVRDIRDAPGITFWGESRESPDQRQIDSFAHYVHLRRTVRDRGLDALPASPPARSVGHEPPWTRERLREILSST